MTTSTINPPAIASTSGSTSTTTTTPTMLLAIRSPRFPSHHHKHRDIFGYEDDIFGSTYPYTVIEVPNTPVDPLKQVIGAIPYPYLIPQPARRYGIRNIVSMGPYGLPQAYSSLDISKDEEVKEKVVEYYYEKFYTKWFLSDEFDDIRNLIKKNNLVKKTGEHSDSYDLIKYLKSEKIVTRNLLREICHKYRKSIDISWIDIVEKQHSNRIKELLHEYLDLKFTKLSHTLKSSKN